MLASNGASTTIYCHVSIAELETLVYELLPIGRSIARWRADMALQRFIAPVANRMFQNESCRVHRHEPSAPADMSMLREKLRAARAARGDARRRKKVVVFFGDGAFKSTVRGKQSVPKKRLLKVLGATGLTVLLGEYNTSKMCPCGMDELITPKPRPIASVSASTRRAGTSARCWRW